MQAEFGYDPDPPLEGNLAVCSNQVAQRFDCLGVTLEMPFKVCASNAGEVNFDGGRCAALGASLLDALAHVGPQLRGVAEPKFYLPDDAYVAPCEDAGKVAARLKELGLA